MGWSDIKSSERWGLIASIFQASATVGMFIVAIIGISKVVPIITYQTYQIEQKQQEEEIEKKEKAEQAELGTKLPKHSPSADRFVNDVLGWWTNQVESYQQIMDSIKDKGQQQKISFRVVGGKSDASDPVNSPDFLVVNAVSASGKKKVIKVAVNDRAMNPNQYIQCKINQGLLYDMAAPERQKVEIAITRYIHEGMVSKVPPAYVQSDMSLKQIHEAISYHQAQRIEAIKQIRALQGVVEAALE